MAHIIFYLGTDLLHDEATTLEVCFLRTEHQSVAADSSCYCVAANRRLERRSTVRANLLAEGTPSVSEHNLPKQAHSEKAKMRCCDKLLGAFQSAPPVLGLVITVRRTTASRHFFTTPAET